MSRNVGHGRVTLLSHAYRASRNLFKVCPHCGQRACQLSSRNEGRGCLQVHTGERRRGRGRAYCAGGGHCRRGTSGRTRSSTGARLADADRGHARICPPSSSRTRRSRSSKTWTRKRRSWKIWTRKRRRSLGSARPLPFAAGWKRIRTLRSSGRRLSSVGPCRLRLQAHGSQRRAVPRAVSTRRDRRVLRQEERGEKGSGREQVKRSSVRARDSGHLAGVSTSGLPRGLSSRSLAIAQAVTRSSATVLCALCRVAAGLVGAVCDSRGDRRSPPLATRKCTWQSASFLNAKMCNFQLFGVRNAHAHSEKTMRIVFFHGITRIALLLCCP